MASTTMQLNEKFDITKAGIGQKYPGMLHNS